MYSSYLVTGGAGFIGSHTVDTLLAEGKRVTVLDIVPETDAKNLASVMTNLQYIQGDITNYDVVTKAMQGIDCVIHLAAEVSVPVSIQYPIRTHNTNVNGTLNVFQAAEENGVRSIVYASSAAVYGDTNQLPVTEAQQTSPQSPYALHKLINEQYAVYYAKRGTLSMVGLRYFNVFGPRQDPGSAYSGVISLCRKHLLDGTTFTIFGDGEQTRDFVSVFDVATANLLASEKGKSGNVYNIATGTDVSLNTLLEEVNSISSKTLTVEYGAPRPGDIVRSCASIEKAKDELGYQPVHERTEVLQALMQQE